MYLAPDTLFGAAELKRVPLAFALGLDDGATKSIVTEIVEAVTYVLPTICAAKQTERPTPND